MNKESYDQVGTISILLNERLDELKQAQKEKESILEWIDTLTKQGLLEESANIIRNTMNKNLVKFQTIIARIEEIRKLCGGQNE